MKRMRTAEGSIEAGNRLLRAMKLVHPNSPVKGDLTMGDGEEIRLTVDNVKLVTCKDVHGTGKLVVTTRRLAWLQRLQTPEGVTFGAGYELSYPSIVMHAICRDPEAFPDPCIYCHVDVAQAESDKDGNAAGLSRSHEQGEDEEMEGGTEEMRLIPAESEALGPLFEAMSACAELQSVADGDGDMDDNGDGGYEFISGDSAGAGLQGGQWFTADMDEAQVTQHLSEDGRSGLARLERLLAGSVPDAAGLASVPGQFDDAPEDA